MAAVRFFHRALSGAADPRQPISTVVESRELRINLIAAHSHIRGLGVEADTLVPKQSSQGLVGQEKALDPGRLLVYCNIAEPRS